MQRLVWALYVEHEWVPGAEALIGAPGPDLRGPAYHQRQKARVAAKHLMERLLLVDEPVEPAVEAVG